MVSPALPAMTSHSTKEGTDRKPLLRSIELRHVMGLLHCLPQLHRSREEQLEMSQPPQPPPTLVPSHCWSPHPPLGRKPHFSMVFITLTLRAPGPNWNQMWPAESKDAAQTRRVDEWRFCEANSTQREKKRCQRVCRWIRHPSSLPQTVPHCSDSVVFLGMSTRPSTCVSYETVARSVMHLLVFAFPSSLPGIFSPHPCCPGIYFLTKP